MKSTRSVLLAALTSLNCLIGGCQRPAEDAEADDPPLKPVPVQVATATTTTLRPSIDLIGTIVPVPERTTEIAAQTDGRITSIAVVEGRTVRAGDVLIELDPRPAEARLAGALAAEQRARATLEKLQHGPRADEIEAARQTARQLTAAARSQAAKLDALRPMHEKGEISEVEFKQAQNRFDAADAEKNAAESRLRLLEVGTRPEELAEARAELAAVEADVASKKLAVEFCTIRSPIGGVVTQLATRVGASVTRTDVLATVIDTSEMFVQARIPSTYYAQVRPGAPAETSTERPDQPAVRGKVARLGPRAHPATGDVDVFVSLDNTSGRLVPGLACRVRIWLPEVEGALSIPAAAVADRDGTPVVTVIRENKAHEQSIELGVTTRDQVQVLSGLEPGDLVATEGGYGLPDGCPVLPTDAP